MTLTSTLFRTTTAVSIITMAVRLLGYFEKALLAYYLGTNAQVDAYNLVMSIILGIFFMFREIANPVFLNIFLNNVKIGGYSEGWSFFHWTLRYAFVCSISITLLSLLFPQVIIGIFAPGFKDGARKMAIDLIRPGSLAIIFLSLSVLTNVALNGVKKFVLPAFGDMIFKITGLLSIIFLYKYVGINAAALGVVAGSFTKFIYHYYFLSKETSFHPISIKDSYGKRIWKLSWPLLIGAVCAQMIGVVDNLFASYLKPGTISALNYSKKLIELPILLFPDILAAVSFPYLSELSLANQNYRRVRLFIRSLKWIILIFTPLSIFCFFFSAQITALAFKRGAFDQNSVILTALFLKYYSVGLVFHAVESVLVKFYFTNSNFKTPVKIGVLCVGINIVATILLIPFIDSVAIPLAFVISKSIKVSILLFKQRKLILRCWDVNVISTR